MHPEHVDRGIKNKLKLDLIHKFIEKFFFLYNRCPRVNTGFNLEKYDIMRFIIKYMSVK